MFKEEFSNNIDLKNNQLHSNKIKNEVEKLNVIVENCIHKVNNNHIEKLNELESDIKEIMFQTNQIINCIETNLNFSFLHTTYK